MNWSTDGKRRNAAQKGNANGTRIGNKNYGTSKGRMGDSTFGYGVLIVVAKYGDSKMLVVITLMNFWLNIIIIENFCLESMETK